MTHITPTQPTTLVGRFFDNFTPTKPPAGPIEQAAKSALTSIESDQKSILSSFWQNSFAPLARNVQKENIGLPAATLVLATLESQFGSSLVQIVANRYGLNNKVTFDLNDLRAMLVGIAVHVKPEHLKERLEVLCKTDTAWQNVQSFETLDKAQLNCLVEMFRLNIPSELLSKMTFQGNEAQTTAFAADLKNLKKFEQAGSFRYDADQEEAVIEYLSHEIIYSNLEVGNIVPVRTSSTEISYLKITKTIYGDGFTSFIFTHLFENTNAGEPMNVYVAHRGTNFGDVKCVRRLTEPHSAGHYSYNTYELEVLKGLQECIPARATNVRIHNGGHSLGGADSARTTVAIAKFLSVLKQAVRMNPAAFANHPFLKVREIKTGLWNATGIAESTNEAFKKAEKEINCHDVTTRTDDDDDFELVEKPVADADPSKVKFSITYGKVAGDPIQQCGETNLHTHSPYVTAKELKFDQGYAGWFAIAHNFGVSGLWAHCAKNTNKPIQPLVRSSQLEVETAAQRHFWHGYKMPLWDRTKWTVGSFFLGTN